MKLLNRININIIFLSIALINVIAFSLPITVRGTEGTYYVKPILSKEQHQDILDYYSFDSSESLDTTLEVLIVNESDEDKSFIVSLFDSFTSDTINVYYDKNQIYDETLKYKFSEFGEVKETVEIKSNNSQILKIPIKKELKDFSGTILGAINIVENKTVDEKNSGVTNVFAYNIPVRIDINNKNQKDVLTYEGVELTTEKYKYILNTTFRNEPSKLIRDINFSFKIESTDEEKKVYYDETKENLQIAPNTIFSPKISLEKSNITAGTYLLTIKATNDNYNEEWKSEFTITKKEAKNINNGFSVTGPEKKAFNYWWIVAIIIVVITSIILIVFYRKKKKPSVEITTHKKVKRKRKKTK